MKPPDPKAQLIERIRTIWAGNIVRHEMFDELASAWLEDLEKARREVEGKFRCDYCEIYQHPSNIRATYGSDAKVTGRICDSCVQKAMATLTNKSKDK